MIPFSFLHPNKVQIEGGPQWSEQWFPEKHLYNGQFVHSPTNLSVSLQLGYIQVPSGFRVGICQNMESL